MTVNVGSMYIYDTNKVDKNNKSIYEVYICKNKNTYYKIGELLISESNIVFEIDYKSMEIYCFYKYQRDIEDLRLTTEEEKKTIIKKLKREKYFGFDIEDDLYITYYEKMCEMIGAKI